MRISMLMCPPDVALLAEGVDRNTATLAANPYVLASPSSQRAWIEISVCLQSL